MKTADDLDIDAYARVQYTYTYTYLYLKSYVGTPSPEGWRPFLRESWVRPWFVIIA